MKLTILSRDSLAARYTRIAAALALATTVLLGATAAFGVYRVMRSEQQARVGAYRDILRLEVSSHLQTAHRLARGLADRSEVAAGAGSRAKLVLGMAILDNGAYLSQLTLAEPSGTVLASYPATDTPSATEIRAWTDRLRSEDGRSAWIVDGSTVRIAFWAGPSGSASRVLFARVQMERVTSTLEQIASTARSPMAFIRDEQGRVLFSGGPIAEVESPEIEATGDLEGAGGRISLMLPRGRMEGAIGRVTGVPGIAWDVAVLEPARAAMNETWAALRPAIIVYLGVLVLVVVVAAVAFSWLVRPLRALESRARAAAQGAVLDPVAVDRGDEVGRLLESFNLVTMRLNRLQESAQLLAKTEELDEVAHNVVRAVVHLVGVCDAAVLLADEDDQGAGTLRVAALHGSFQQRVAASGIGTASRVVRDALESGETKVVSTGLQSLLGHGKKKPETSDSVTLIVPLRASGRTVGVLAVSRTEERPFSDAERELLASFSVQAALALEKARLFERERQARVEAEVLQRAARLLVEESDLYEALRQVAKCEAEALDMPWSFAWLDPALSSDDVEAAPSTEISELLETLERRQRGIEQEGVWSGVLEVRAVDGEPASMWLARHALAVALVTYAVHDGRVMGMLVVGSEDVSSVVDERRMRIVETIGKEIALALERARLFKEAQDRAASLETVFRISQAVSSSLQVNVVLGRVLDVVQKLFNADAVILMRWNHDRRVLEVPMARGMLDRAMLDYRCGADEDLPGAVLQTQQVMLISHLEEVGTRFARTVLRKGLRSALLVPLVARGKAIGVLVTLGTQPERFTRSDADLLSTFASHAALAIDTAELFSREHEVSRVLQASILPARLPEFDGLELGSAYAPAQGAARIGGDYYDVFAAADGRVVLVIADVCGKGVEAATKTSMIRFTVRGMVAAGAGPKDILEALNQMVHDSGDPSDIFTIWLGMLDVEDGLLTWADGGHPPALLWRRADNAIERLGTTGPLLGAVRDATYEESAVTLAPGDRVLLYTDGVSEARRNGQLFGEGRIRRVLRRARDAASVPGALLAEVQRFSGGAIRDDAAILSVGYLGVVRFTPEGTRGNTIGYDEPKA